MADMPMDIITDLFLRLPASTLVRCRVLSKPCFSLIDSPDFISSHLHHTLETGDHLMILLRGPRLLVTVDLDSPDKVSDVEHPLKAGGLTEVFGSCNGLIGLSNSPTDMALFNPSTRQIHRLPAEPVDFPEGSRTRGYVFYGLGYDSVNEDYKVVRMIQCKGGAADELVFGFPYEVKVFSLKMNTWKRVKRLLPAIQLLFYFYYHLLYRRGYDTYLPESLAHENIDIGEYKVVEGSWSKVFSVPKPKSVESFDFMRPLLYSKDRRKVLIEVKTRSFVVILVKLREGEKRRALEDKMIAAEE
ncbi:hypothetical protein HID58_056930 [Brassica napus]|uniref:F-box domain-containing protein n=1 Tax=Brassica napus TaxID=3708 RepID=A0ABQ8AQZ6_BRANA|nr:hypothetical protein HID58_056930 [Brassica napus]